MPLTELENILGWISTNMPPHPGEWRLDKAQHIRAGSANAAARTVAILGTRAVQEIVLGSAFGGARVFGGVDRPANHQPVGARHRSKSLKWFPLD